MFIFVEFTAVRVALPALIFVDAISVIKALPDVKLVELAFTITVSCVIRSELLVIPSKFAEEAFSGPVEIAVARILPATSILYSGEVVPTPRLPAV